MCRQGTRRTELRLDGLEISGKIFDAHPAAGVRRIVLTHASRHLRVLARDRRRAPNIRLRSTGLLPEIRRTAAVGRRNQPRFSPMAGMRMAAGAFESAISPAVTHISLNRPIEPRPR
jgi:hypothetical protein